MEPSQPTECSFIRADVVGPWKSGTTLFGQLDVKNTISLVGTTGGTILSTVGPINLVSGTGVIDAGGATLVNVTVIENPNFITLVTDPVTTTGPEVATMLIRGTDTNFLYLIEAQAAAKSTDPSMFCTFMLAATVNNDAGTVSAVTTSTNSHLSAGIVGAYLEVIGGPGTFAIRCHGDDNGNVLMWRAMVRILRTSNTIPPP